MSTLQTLGGAYVAAINAGDRPAAFAAAAELTRWLADPSHRIEPDAAFQLVWAAAVRQRWFDLAELLAATLAARADAPPAWLRLHGQFLMERGLSVEAQARLEPLLDDRQLDPFERAQTLGHLGRIHKDRFIAAQRDGRDPAPHWAAAVEHYLRGWSEKLPDCGWHGVNALALLARPEATTLAATAGTGLPAVGELASALEAAVVAADPARLRAYSVATLAEVALARNDPLAALAQVQRYVVHPVASTFSLGATLRQLEQVWRLDRRPSPGPETLALLRAELLQRGNAGFTLSGSQVVQTMRALDRLQSRNAATPADTRAGVVREAVFGADRFSSIENYRRGLQRCAHVARIGRSAEVGVGTGFVLPGRLLHAQWGDEWVLVSNAHVLNESEAERAAGALHPEEAIVTFAALDGVAPEREFQLAGLLFSSAPDALDVSVARLTEALPGKADASAYQVASVLPAPGATAEVRVIGHPSGRGLSLSSNQLLDHEAPRIHYLTATEGGSSGSPVFNSEWRLIGVHHAGGDRMPRLRGAGGTYAANEGIWIEAIRAAIRENP